jgi:hypothetical protein
MKAKDIKKIETALALYYVHCAVAAAVATAGEDPVDIARHVRMTCCDVPEDANMDTRIKSDNMIPEATAKWLIKIWDVLDHKEANDAFEMVSVMLIGASMHDRLHDLEDYGIL